MSESSPGARPRREAAPLPFEQLTIDQKEEGQRAVELITKLAQVEPLRAPTSERHPYLPELDPKRNSQVVLIDGSRGSGKTQLLLSLLAAWRDVALQKEAADSFGGHVKPSHRIIPVGLVDLQPLPEDTNLLFHLLGNLELVVRAMEGMGPEGGMGGGRARVPEPWEETDTQELNSRKRWREFTRAAAYGWGGNLKERRGRLDPESYAVELEHGELERLNAMHGFRRFMNALVEDYQQWRGWEPSQRPFFLLAIDDADMNPRRAYEVLEMIRQLWHSRLGFILTGDSDLFRAVLRVWFDGQLDSKEAARASGLAFEVYDKLIPSEHRLVLPSLKPEERLLMPREAPLGTVLRRFRLREKETQDARPKTLEDLFNVLPQTREALSGRLRSLLALQGTLERIAPPTGYQREATAQAVIEIWERALGAAQVSNTDTERLKQLVRLDREGGALNVDVTFLEEVIAHRSMLTFELRQDWMAAVAVPGAMKAFLEEASKRRSREVPGRVLGALMLAYETARAEPRHSCQGALMPWRSEEGFWVGAEWYREKSLVIFPWVTPDWQSLVDFQLFSQDWQKHVEPLTQLGQVELDELARVFLELVFRGSGLVAAQQATEKKEAEFWAQWAQKVADLSQKGANVRLQPMARWASYHAAQLATPEAGTSPELATGILDALRRAHGTSWREAAKLQREGRLQRLQEALSHSYKQQVSREDAEKMAAQIDEDQQRHPWVRKIRAFLEPSQGKEEALVSHLVNDAMNGFPAPAAARVLGEHSRGLGTYITPLRKKLLSESPAGSLKVAIKKFREYSDIMNSTQHALVEFWRIMSGQAALFNSDEFTLGEEGLVMRREDVRQGFHHLLLGLIRKSPQSPWRLTSVQGMRFELEKKIASERLPTLKTPRHVDGTFRILHDYAIDQDDGLPNSPQMEWWPYVRVQLPDGVGFSPWPAVPWPTLLEWELLRHHWQKARKETRRLGRNLPAGSASSILDALGFWFLNAIAMCRSRGLPGSTIRATVSEKDWSDWFARERELGATTSAGNRAQAMALWWRHLPLMATPESGLGVEAARTILAATESGRASTQELNQMRLQRLLDADIPLEKARASLVALDRLFQKQQHPWIQTVGAFPEHEPGPTPETQG